MKTTPRQKSCIAAFNKKILQDEIEFEEVPCLCSGKEFSLVATKDRYSFLQKIVLCKKCGLMQNNPRMREDQYKSFYISDAYRGCYERDNYLDICEKFYNPNFGKHIFNAVLKVKNLPDVKSVLEIGCGGGWNLVPFKNEGITVSGYDLSPSLIALGKEHGLNLIHGGIDDIKGKFDVIILNHVVEHFTDPVKSMVKAKQNLKPDGIFYIAVPDMENFGTWQLQNAHTYYFTSPTLQYYMSKAGLSLLWRGLAQKTHLFAIFSSKSQLLPEDFLKGNYVHMEKIIKRSKNPYFAFLKKIARIPKRFV